MNEIKLYSWNDAPEKMRALLPPSWSEARPEYQRPGRAVMIVPEACVDGWERDRHDGKWIPQWKAPYAFLMRVCHSIDAVADPFYVRTSNGVVIVIGRD